MYSKKLFWQIFNLFQNASSAHRLQILTVLSVNRYCQPTAQFLGISASHKSLRAKPCVVVPQNGLLSDSSPAHQLTTARPVWTSWDDPDATAESSPSAVLVAIPAPQPETTLLAQLPRPERLLCVPTLPPTIVASFCVEAIPLRGDASPASPCARTRSIAFRVMATAAIVRMFRPWNCQMLLEQQSSMRSPRHWWLWSPFWQEPSSSNYFNGDQWRKNVLVIFRIFCMTLLRIRLRTSHIPEQLLWAR